MYIHTVRIYVHTCIHMYCMIVLLMGKHTYTYTYVYIRMYVHTAHTSIVSGTIDKVSMYSTYVLYGLCTYVHKSCMYVCMYIRTSDAHAPPPHSLTPQWCPAWSAPRPCTAHWLEDEGQSLEWTGGSPLWTQVIHILVCHWETVGCSPPSTVETGQSMHACTYVRTHTYVGIW